MKIHWLRILIAGVVAELALMLIVPLNFIPGGPTILQIIVIPACFGALFVAGWWAARPARALHWLHGLLAGLLALVIYAALTWGQDLPLTFHIGSAAKLVGGIAGALFAARRGGAAAA